MPIRQGGTLASRASTWPRDHFCMREREIKGKKESPTLNFIGPAKAGNWKQLQSEDDAVSILEEFARDAMRFGGYLCEGVETNRELASLSEQFGDARTKSSFQFV